eukprot:TRINITY_DN4167_c0_g2_i1.p1 TRINITY_DN4167_c0_g2~~TRINITY_DN4167_c0_g2_i1.p1  ORF type:complete len:1073 (+),score=314.90 TRINITY_DN4167_c0_g2_i1:53-3271(+)
MSVSVVPDTPVGPGQAATSSIAIDVDSGPQAPPRSGIPHVEASEVSDRRADIPCKPDCFATVLRPEEEPVIWTSTGDGRVAIRNTAGEVIGRLTDVTIQPTAMCVVGNAVWIGTQSGRILVYDLAGAFSTMLKEGSAVGRSTSAPVSVMCSYGDRVWSASMSKDVVEWDARRFCVSKVLFSRRAGDTVLSLCPGKVGQQFALFVGTRQAIRAWDSDGREGPTAEGGSRSLVHVGSQDQLWAASEQGVVVYSTARPGDTLLALRCFEGRPVVQLLHVASGDRVWSFDDEQIKVYSVDNFDAIQTLQAPPRFSGRNAYVAYRRESTRVWISSDDGSRLRFWDAVVNVSPHHGPKVGETTAESQELVQTKNENQYLRKKVKYIQSVGTIFRQRIGILFKEKLRQRDYGVTADLAEFDKMYNQALAKAMEVDAEKSPEKSVEVHSPQAEAAGATGTTVAQLMLEKETLQLALNAALSSSAQEPARHGTTEAEGMVRHWKDKCKAASDELNAAKQEIERLVAVVENAGPQKDIDIKRAFHICEVLREKNLLKEALQEKEMALENCKKELAAAKESELEWKNNASDHFAQVIRQQHGDAGQGGHPPALPPPDRGPEESQRGYPIEQGGDMLAAKEKQYSLVLDQMREDNEKLKRDLSEANSRLERCKHEVDACKLIRKQNNHLKARLADARQQLNAQKTGTSTDQTEMQANMEILMANISQLQTELGTKDASIQELSADKLSLMQDISRMTTILERYKTKVLTLEREQITRSKAEQLQDREHRQETRALCESLDSREAKVQQLQANFVDISEQLQHQIQQVARTNHELDLMSRENMVLKSKLQQLDLLLDERKEFSGLLGEVQGRMEMAVEELKTSQSTAELAAEVANLEQRVAGLAALEAQLKQKDDVIALRDDEIQRLKLRLAMFEQSVNNVSSCFLQFPHTIEEMETILIENEEFRRVACAGENTELQERIKLRRLDVEAQRAQRSQQALVEAQQEAVTGSLDAATNALLARLGDSSDSDDDSITTADLARLSKPADATARLRIALGMDSESGSSITGDRELATPRAASGTPRRD